MHRPRVCCKVHEEETERPRLSNGDHPWDCSARTGHSQSSGGQPPSGLWDGFWDGASPGVVSSHCEEDTNTHILQNIYICKKNITKKPLWFFWILTKLIINCLNLTGFFHPAMSVLTWKFLMTVNISKTTSAMKLGHLHNINASKVQKWLFSEVKNTIWSHD